MLLQIAYLWSNENEVRVISNELSRPKAVLTGLLKGWRVRSLGGLWWIINILHDPKHLKLGELWYYALLRPCRMFRLNRVILSLGFGFLGSRVTTG